MEFSLRVGDMSFFVFCEFEIVIFKIVQVMTENIPSGGFRGGSRGSLEPPSGPTLFRFHGEFQKIVCEIRQTNPPFLHLNPLFRNPGSAPDTFCVSLCTEYICPL